MTHLFSPINWFPFFQKYLLPYQTFPLSSEILSFIQSDQPQLPEELFSQSFLSALSSSNDQAITQQTLSYSPISPSLRSFFLSPQFLTFLDFMYSTLQKFRGIYPKIDIISPNDALWVIADRSIKCFTTKEILLLLTSSGKIYDYISQTKNVDKLSLSLHNSSLLTLPIQFHVQPHLILRKWFNTIHSSESWRVFVSNGKIIGVTQRDGILYQSMQSTSFIDDLHKKILNFHNNIFLNNFIKYQQSIQDLIASNLEISDSDILSMNPEYKQFLTTSLYYDIYISPKNVIKILDLQPLPFINNLDGINNLPSLYDDVPSILFSPQDLFTLHKHQLVEHTSMNLFKDIISSHYNINISGQNTDRLTYLYLISKLPNISFPLPRNLLTITTSPTFTPLPFISLLQKTYYDDTNCIWSIVKNITIDFILFILQRAKTQPHEISSKNSCKVQLDIDITNDMIYTEFYDVSSPLSTYLFPNAQEHKFYGLHPTKIYNLLLHFHLLPQFIPEYIITLCNNLLSSLIQIFKDPIFFSQVSELCSIEITRSSQISAQSSQSEHIAQELPPHYIILPSDQIKLENMAEIILTKFFSLSLTVCAIVESLHTIYMAWNPSIDSDTFISDVVQHASNHKTQLLDDYAGQGVIFNPQNNFVKVFSQSSSNDDDYEQFQHISQYIWPENDDSIDCDESTNFIISQKLSQADLSITDNTLINKTSSIGYIRMMLSYPHFFLPDIDISIDNDTTQYLFPIRIVMPHNKHLAEQKMTIANEVERLPEEHCHQQIDVSSADGIQKYIELMQLWEQNQTDSSSDDDSSDDDSSD